MDRTRVGLRALLFPSLFLGVAACGDEALGGEDADGITGGDYTFVVRVSDAEFAPSILKSQNEATITLTLENTGTKPHDFVLDEIPSATIAPIEPSKSATLTFKTPFKEGIFVFRSTQPGDAQTGQFIIQ